MPTVEGPGLRPLNPDDLAEVTGGMAARHEQEEVPATPIPPPEADDAEPLGDEDAPQVTTGTATPTGSDHTAVWRPGDGNLDFRAGMIQPDGSHWNELELDLSGLTYDEVRESLGQASFSLNPPGQHGYWEPEPQFYLRPDHLIIPSGQGTLTLFGETVTFSGVYRITLRF